MDVERRIAAWFEELIEESQEGFKGYPVTDEFWGWSISALDLLERIFGSSDRRCLEFETSLDKIKSRASISSAHWTDISWLVGSCISIITSSFRDFNKGYLIEIKTLIKSELGDDLIERSRELLNSGQKDLACLVGGIALELGLRDLASRQGLDPDRKVKTESINRSLRKQDTYNESMRKQVSAWLALRNHAAHGEWSEYEPQHVAAMLEGVERFLGQYLS